MNAESVANAAAIRIRHPHLIALIAAFTALAPLATDFTLPVMPSISASLDASVPSVAATVSVTLLGLALGQVFAGPISDQVGRRGPLIAGLIAFSVLNVACGLAPNISVLLVVRFLVGLASATSFVVSRAIIADVYPGADLARAFALLGSIMAIAPVIAPICGGLLSPMMDWRGMFFVLGGVGLLLTVLAMARVPESNPVDHRQATGLMPALRELGNCLAHRSFMTYVGCTAMSGATLFSYIAGSSFVLEGRFGLSATGFSLVFALNSVGIFLMALTGRRLVTNLGSARLLWAGQILSAIGAAVVLGALVTGSLAFVVIGMFVAIGSIGLITANAMALGITASPARSGAASALLGVAGFAVGGLLSPLGGIGGSSSDALGVLMVAFTLLGLAIHRVMLGRGTQVE